MTDKTTGDLTAASALDGTELVHVVQSGNSRKATVEEIVQAQLPLTVARYWRLWNLHAWTAAGRNAAPGVAEIEFRATVGGSRLSGTVSATDWFDGSTVPANANDSNNTTIWATAGTGQLHFFEIDLGAGNDSTVQEIAIRARPTFMEQAPRGFDVQSSQDGIIWKTHGSVRDRGAAYGASEIRAFDVSSITRG